MRRWFRRYRWTIFMVVLLVIYLSPMIWVVSTSLKDKGQFFTYPPIFIPGDFHFENFLNGLYERGGLGGIINSLIIAGGCTIFSLVLSLPAAYSFAYHRIGGKHLSFWVLSIRMLPPIAVALPIFLMYRSWGLLDTYIGMILIHSIINIPFAVWILKGFFEELPYTVLESAFVDGCNIFQVFTRVAIPLVTPGIVTAALFSFIFSWNEFMFALILTRKAVTPITVVLPNLIGGHEVLWGQIAAIALMASTPVIVFAFILQRHLVRGLTLGAVKE